MKSRRVFVTLEVETLMALADMRRSSWWNSLFSVAHVSWSMKAMQASANVAREEKPLTRKRAFAFFEPTKPKRKRARRKS